MKTQPLVFRKFSARRARRRGRNCAERETRRRSSTLLVAKSRFSVIDVQVPIPLSVDSKRVVDAELNTGEDGIRILLVSSSGSLMTFLSLNCASKFNQIIFSINLFY